MLSIDEAIAHAREVANTQRGKSGICLQNGLECEHFSACLKCSKEHEQLAEWLEELKALREEKSDFQIKQIAKKPTKDKYVPELDFCPECGTEVTNCNYCPYCGQKIKIVE